MGRSVGRSVRSRFKWSILLSLALLAAIILGGTWLAFTVEAETKVTIDAQSGDIVINGTEVEFVGSAHGQVGERAVTINGLPAVEALRKHPLALRAVCAMRMDESTDWSEAGASLRSYLQSSQFGALCDSLD